MNVPSYGHTVHGSKRRRVDDTGGRLTSNSRQGGSSRRDALAGERSDHVHVPRLDFIKMPATSVHSYLLHYGVIATHPLDHRHATFPPTVAALRATALAGPPMITRLDKAGRVKSRTVTYEPTSLAPRAYQQHVDEPPTPELCGPPAAEQDPQEADARLIHLARQHWQTNTAVKEGESVSNFIFHLRKRARVHN